MRFVCKEFKSHNNTSNLHLAGTLMVTFKLISRCFPWISCRCFQIIPPYGGSMDDGPSRTYLSSRPTFKFPDIGYSGYCRVFQRYLSLSFAWLYLRSEPDFSNAFAGHTSPAGLQVGWNWNFKETFCPCQWVKSKWKHLVNALPE